MFNAGVELLAKSLRVEVPEDDPAEDGRHRSVGEQVDVQRVEMSNEAACDTGSEIIFNWT